MGVTLGLSPHRIGNAGWRAGEHLRGRRNLRRVNDDVLLVTCSDLPEGEPGGDLLLRACADAGIGARWVAWDDDSVDWASARVAVRATWDYENRLEEFLTWARSVPQLLNGAEVFAWNTDKSYLVELQDAGVPVVPSIVAPNAVALADALTRFERPLLKPTVGAGGRGVHVIEPDSMLTDIGEPPWLVQPLVESVRTEGEVSVFVLGGEAVSQVVKLPAGGEVRVHEEYGGSTRPVELDPELGRIARSVVQATESLKGFDLAYARVDLMSYDGQWLLSELEVTEPGLYLDELPGNAAEFVARVLQA